jgi:hypothetical protein
VVLLWFAACLCFFSCTLLIENEADKLPPHHVQLPGMQRWPLQHRQRGGQHAM